MSMSRSASMYNSPYTYKPPPPKIDYPPLFSCQKFTCGHFLEAKFLAIGVLVLGVAVNVVIGMLIAPFWFQLVFDPQQGTFGSEPVINQLTVDTGIFFMRESRFNNLAFTETFTSRDTLPKPLQLAHYLAVLGAVILVPSFAAGIILMFRRFSSPTALIILASAVSLTAFCECGVIILCGILMGMSSCDPYAGSGCEYTQNAVWRLIPMYERFFRVEPHVTPFVKPNWAFFIAIAGAILCIAAALLLWIEVKVTHDNLNKIRYEQMRTARDPYEKDANPWVGRKHVYQPPLRQGPTSYGMQPVMHANPYQPFAFAQPDTSTVYITPATLSHRPPSPGFQRGGTPSVNSSTSGAYVSREIDL